MSSPSQRQGAQHEQQAVEELERRGLTVVTRNYHCRAGEIDIIALGEPKARPRHQTRGPARQPNQSLHFIEVRYRSDDRFGGAAASVTAAKQKKLRRTAQIFLQRHPRFRNHRAQFDVVTFSGTNYPLTMAWIESAF